MKWSTARELLKTFAVLALDLLGFFAILTLLMAVFVAAVAGVIVVIWFWLQLLF